MCIPLSIPDFVFTIFNPFDIKHWIILFGVLFWITYKFKFVLLRKILLFVVAYNILYAAYGMYHNTYVVNSYGELR